MKHRAPTAPLRARTAAVTAIAIAHQVRGAGHSPRHAHPERRHTPRHAAPSELRGAATVGVSLGVVAATTLSAGPLLAAPPAAGPAPSAAASVLAEQDTDRPADPTYSDVTGYGPRADGSLTRDGSLARDGGLTTRDGLTASTGLTDVSSPTGGGTDADGTGLTTLPGTTGAAGGDDALLDRAAHVLTGRVSRDAQRPVPVKAQPGPTWRSPMPAGEITSCYGPRWGALHAGIDLAAPSGTPVHAVGAGRVVSAGWNYAGYGISVMVDHGNGYLTHYAHLSKASVRAGDRVAAGQVLGQEGSTGDSTGPHLHFEVHKGQWRQVDPTPWLRAHGVRVAC